MKIRFESLNESHKSAVMEIFNQYAETGTAAFTEGRVPEAAYAAFAGGCDRLPGYAVIEEATDRVIGFCLLKPYHPLGTFRKTLDLTYFLDPAYTGKGIGGQCLAKLEADAKAMGVEYLIAQISSENDGSIRFHEHHGFRRCGQLENVGYKLNRSFGIVFMQKDL